MRLAGFLGSRSLAIPLFVAAVNLGLTFTTQFATFRNFPNSGDEYAYLVSAEIFARGRLSVPSPEPRKFFDVTHVVNDGKFYGKYPPGWSALLAPGVAAGVPWLVNPLLGLAALLATYVLSRRHFGVEVANTACLLLLGNPFLVLNAASWFPHTACLLASVLFVHFLLVCVEEPGNRRSAFGMGLAAGVAFTMRPFTIVAIAAVPAFYLLFQLRGTQDRRVRLGDLVCAVLPFGVCLFALLAYNHAQTGNAFLNPFEAYASWDSPAIPRNPSDWIARVHTHLVRRGLDLGWWMPLSPLLVAAAVVLAVKRRDPKAMVLAGSALALFVAFFFYWAEGGFRYGPRYLHEVAGLVAILSATVLVRTGRFAALLLVVLVACNAWVFRDSSREAARILHHKQDVYRLVEQKGLSDAVVFVRTGSGMAPISDLPRNGIDFDGKVLYVRDRGPANVELRRAYPRREPWVYSFDFRRWRGSLQPYPSSAEDGRAVQAGPGS